MDNKKTRQVVPNKQEGNEHQYPAKAKQVQIKHSGNRVRMQSSQRGPSHQPSKRSQQKRLKLVQRDQQMLLLTWFLVIMTAILVIAAILPIILRILGAWQ
jgi:hypothetical protein